MNLGVHIDLALGWAGKAEDVFSVFFRKAEVVPLKGIYLI